MKMSQRRITFAMGGLGGFNAHGVGFLKAALNQDIRPDTISCTSGQIYWVWRYLLELNQQGADIEAELADEISHSNRFPQGLEWLDSALMMFRGADGIFAPAATEYWKNLLTPVNPLTQGFNAEQLGNQLLNRLMPAQLFRTKRSEDIFRKIGCRLAEEQEISLIFNAYDARNGHEVLYMNRRAQQQLNLKAGSYQDQSFHHHSLVQILDPDNHAACADAVENALWLYLYGFTREDGSEQTIVDGAYHRQFIIRELAAISDLIFTVRPLNYAWEARMPANQLEVFNFIIQMWFNSAYDGETARIAMINDLISKGHLSSSSPYKPIDLESVEYPHPIHHNEFFVERADVYREALQSSTQRFTLLRQQQRL